MSTATFMNHYRLECKRPKIVVYLRHGGLRHNSVFWKNKIPSLMVMLEWLVRMEMLLGKEISRLNRIKRAPFTTHFGIAKKKDEALYKMVLGWPDPLWRQEVFGKAGSLRGTVSPFALLQIQEGNRV